MFIKSGKKILEMNTIICTVVKNLNLDSGDLLTHAVGYLLSAAISQVKLKISKNKLRLIKLTKVPPKMSHHLRV